MIKKSIKGIIKKPKYKLELDPEQDSLIARGIKLVSTKLLDLLEICKKECVIFEDEKQHSLLPFDKWQNSLTVLYDELFAWE